MYTVIVERLAVELIIGCTHVCKIPFMRQRQHALDIPPALPRLLGPASIPQISYICSQDGFRMPSMKWAAILGTPLRFVSEEVRLCFGNTISPRRGMNVQMCHRWDSLSRDLAHGVLTADNYRVPTARERSHANVQPHCRWAHTRAWKHGSDFKKTQTIYKHISHVHPPPQFIGRFNCSPMSFSKQNDLKVELCFDASQHIKKDGGARSQVHKNRVWIHNRLFMNLRKSISFYWTWWYSSYSYHKCWSSSTCFDSVNKIFLTCRELSLVDDAQLLIRAQTFTANPFYQYRHRIWLFALLEAAKAPSNPTSTGLHFPFLLFAFSCELPDWQMFSNFGRYENARRPEEARWDAYYKPGVFKHSIWKKIEEIQVHYNKIKVKTQGRNLNVPAHEFIVPLTFAVMKSLLKTAMLYNPFKSAKNTKKKKSSFDQCGICIFRCFTRF